MRPAILKIMECLNDSGSYVRSTAISALSEFLKNGAFHDEMQQAIPKIVECLNDSNPNTSKGEIHPFHRSLPRHPLQRHRFASQSRNPRRLHPRGAAPHHRTVWTVGAQEVITWDTPDAPVNITDKIGRVLLRKAGMTLPVILADNFYILQGSIQVTVPWVEEGDDYQVNLGPTTFSSLCCIFSLRLPQLTANKMKFTSFAALVLATVSGVLASPLEARDVFTPEVLLPTTGTVWTVGAQEMVTWDTSNAPVNITNKIGRVLLRKAGMTLPVILADNFSILQGSVQVTVPWVEDGDDYQVNLFGDSGDFSNVFTISGSP
ncbi:hypothetical protein CVT26_016195 [Gymnopilus dilepis]|uniref:Uncharacterized protein n=1 Tax=Gymnopilus dilepis TaxID=231916 RepID=A0A409XZ31_9AGAR|nr:hypothetical protein CVT26_016195 [Gymnopilus dilepis]